jgi:hypothetical protein
MDAAKTAAAALKTIAKNGRVLPMARRTATFQDITGGESVVTLTIGTITGIVLPRYKGPIFNQMDEALRVAIITGKARTVLAAAAGATFPPKPLDRLTFDGSAWEVVGVSELSPTGTPILYTIGVIESAPFPPLPPDE